jgi:RNA polymerase sigma-70 factor (ECF subfamily)
MFRKAMDHISDEDLMVKSGQGDRRCFEALYDRYADRLYIFFKQMLWQDDVMAQDYTQDIFMKIVQKPELYNPNKPFKTWIFSVANNMCKNAYRRKEVEGRASTELAYRPASIANEGTSKLDYTSFNSALKDSLEGMDSAKRATFILRFKHDLSIRDIAVITETSEGTVKSRIFYTLKALAQELHAYNPYPSHEP